MKFSSISGVVPVITESCNDGVDVFLEGKITPIKTLSLEPEAARATNSFVPFANV